MLTQASVAQLRSGEVSRKDGYIVVAMCFYPRGLKKDLMDEYRANLAPDRELFAEWKKFEAQSGHEQAFVLSHYEERFKLSAEGMESLRRLTDTSKKQKVYFVCQCQVGERCHREILLLIARKHFQAAIGPLHNEYPVFQSRLNAT